MQKVNEIISEWLSKAITVSYKSRLELHVYTHTHTHTHTHTYIYTAGVVVFYK